MRSSIVAVVAVAALTASAQAPFTTPRLRIPALPPRLLIEGPTDCPVHLLATQLYAQSTIWTFANEDPDPHRSVRASSLFPLAFSGRGVHVDVASSFYLVQMPYHLFSAHLAVDYIADAPSDRPATAITPSTKTYTLSLTGLIPVYRLEGDLLVGPVNTITRVRILSVDVDHGLTIPVPDHCSVIPTPEPPATSMSISG